MRILNIIGSLDPSHGGPIDGALRLADIWTANGHDCAFATLDTPDAPYIQAQDRTVFALGSLGAAHLIDRPMKLHERFGHTGQFVPWLNANRGQYDVVLVHGLWNYSSMAASRALPGSGTPYFVFPHGSLDPWFKRRYPLKTVVKQITWPFVEGRLLNHASAVFFTTEEERVLAQDAYLPYRVTPAIVGFGSSDAPPGEERQVAAFHQAFPRLAGRRFLLFLSRIHAKKGCDLLINAFANVAAAIPDLDLVMAGPDQTGWQAELEALAQARGVADRVHWTGMIRDDVKWGAYRASEAFALTSHTENFGIVVAEALACGKPVLISNRVNLWREVAAAEAGLVEPDTQEGADRLLSRFLAMSEADRREISIKARACFEENFRMESAAAKILDVMQRSLAK